MITPTEIFKSLDTTEQEELLVKLQKAKEARDNLDKMEDYCIGEIVGHEVDFDFPSCILEIKVTGRAGVEKALDMACGGSVAVKSNYKRETTKKHVFRF